MLASEAGVAPGSKPGVNKGGHREMQALEDFPAVRVEEGAGRNCGAGSWKQQLGACPPCPWRPRGELLGTGSTGLGRLSLTVRTFSVYDHRKGFRALMAVIISLLGPFFFLRETYAQSYNENQ